MSKSFLQSKTIWGGLLALAGVAVPYALSAIGIDAKTQGDLVVGLGGLLAIYGRLKAIVPIGK